VEYWHLHLSRSETKAQTLRYAPACIGQLTAHAKREDTHFASRRESTGTLCGFGAVCFQRMSLAPAPETLCQLSPLQRLSTLSNNPFCRVRQAGCVMLHHSFMNLRYAQAFLFCFV